MFNQILRPIARRVVQQGVQKRLAHHESNFKFVTLDEATVPQGSWKENFEKQQKKYNVQLIAGVASLVITIVTVLQAELIYFNYVPPKPKDE